MTEQQSENQNLLIFQLNSTQLFGLNVLKIKEIITYSSLNQLPDSHPALAGVTELRGVTLPVIDLGMAMRISRIDVTSEEAPSIVIIECNGKTQGFLVRKVENIIAIKWNDIKAVPKASGIDHFATGVIQHNDKLVTLVDVEKVMHETTDVADDLPTELLTKEQLTKVKGRKILVVDDSLIARKKIASTLEALGIEFQLTDGANDALGLLGESSITFDMIISDIEMPQVNGYEFARKVRELANNHANTYTLLHTSLPVDDNSKDFQHSKADALLTKFVPQALAQAVFNGLTNNCNLN